MKNIYLAVILLLFQSAFSQAEEQEKINKDVWLNFMQAYQDLDASLFNEIHTGEVLRVPADQNIILIGQEYKDQNLETFNRWNAQKVKQRIEFSFIKRIQKDNWGYEIGIYKLTRYNGVTPTSYYSKFNVTLKKVSGIWKIHSDADTNEENTISEEDFLKGSLLKY